MYIIFFLLLLLLQADQMSLHDQQLMLIEEVTLGRLQPEIVDMASVALGMVVELTEEDEELWMHHRDRRGEIADPAQCVRILFRHSHDFLPVHSA